MMAGAEGFEPPSFASEARHLECRVLPLHHAPMLSRPHIVQYFNRILLIIIAEEVFLYLYYIIYFFNFQVARLVGLEPTAHSLEGYCSVQLSYRRKWQEGADLNRNAQFWRLFDYHYLTLLLAPRNKWSTKMAA